MSLKIGCQTTSKQTKCWGETLNSQILLKTSHKNNKLMIDINIPVKTSMWQILECFIEKRA